jgi:TRAP-type mannitol/chloroaromatic compound transport system permease small subunit
MKSIIKAVDAVNNLFGNITAWTAILMMFLVVYEVVSRYIFNAPTRWSMEITQYTFCVASLWAGGYCLLKDKHVRVDILYPKFSSRTQAIVEMITLPVPLVFCAVLVWMGTDEVLASLAENTRSEVMAFPMWPARLIVPIGGFLLGIQVVARYLRNVLFLLGEN